MQLYRPMLKSALSITWRFKYLWFFGLFAALLGNGGAFNFGISNLDKVESQGIFLDDLKQLAKNFSPTINWQAALDGIDFWGILLFTLVLVVGIFTIWLAISSKGALVYGIGLARGGKKGLLSQVFKKGMNKFWPVFLLQLLMTVVLYIALILISLPFWFILINTQNGIIENILIIVSFILLVPIGVILWLIVQYAIIYTVNHDQHVGEALKNACDLFRKNWIVSLETGLLLFLINVLTGLALVVVLIFIALPFIMLAILASYTASNAFFWLVAVLGILTFVLTMFLYGALLNVFQTAAWVILFEKLQGGAVYSRILRWAVGLTTGRKVEG